MTISNLFVPQWINVLFSLAWSQSVWEYLCFGCFRLLLHLLDDQFVDPAWRLRRTLPMYERAWLLFATLYFLGYGLFACRFEKLCGNFLLRPGRTLVDNLSDALLWKLTVHARLALSDWLPNFALLLRFLTSGYLLKHTNKQDETRYMTQGNKLTEENTKIDKCPLI